MNVFPFDHLHQVPLIASVGTKADFNDILKEMLLMGQERSSYI